MPSGRPPAHPRFRLIITKPRLRQRRHTRNPLPWSPFLLTALDDADPSTTTRSACAVFLLFARNFLLCPTRPRIPQLAAPPERPPAQPRPDDLSHTSEASSSPPTAALVSDSTAHEHSLPAAPLQAAAASLAVTASTTTATTTTLTSSSGVITATAQRVVQLGGMSQPSPASPHTPPQQGRRVRVPNPERSESPVRAPEPHAPFLPGLSVEQFMERCEMFIRVELRKTAGVALPSSADPRSVFYGVSPPAISVRDYIQRMVQFSHSSPSTFAVMLAYVRRIGRREPVLRLHNLNLHRLLITSLTVACKVLDDRCFSNAHYAKVGGVPTAREMTTLELLLLRYMGYDLAVCEEDFDEVVQMLHAVPESAQCFPDVEKSAVTQEQDSGPASREQQDGT